jgi:serine/threonine-protein kinase
MAPHDQLRSSPGSDAPAPVATRDLTGRTLADFQVERLLGHGGMGEVYLARQLSLDRPVALKVLRPELLSNPTYMARFESEAWAAAKLNHPNIVHIYTLGGVGGLKFIAMEYVAGTNLREYLARKGTPDLPLALSIMKQAGQAVGAAGEAGLIHRDIKPENLLLTRKGQVKVADFGLCRGPEADKLHLTQPGVTLGTPLYMSPEQVEGRALDHRSDLYSLGVTFYHMLAGSPPFVADSPLALALKHVREQPVSLAVHRPDLPRPLVDLVMRLMAKSPHDRYASAAEMLRDLAKIKESLQTQSLGSMTAATAILPPEPAEEPPRRRGLRGRSPSASKPPADASEGDEPGESPGHAGPPLLGTGMILALGLLAALAGAAGGWMGRTPDLFARDSGPEAAMPGLWLADWAAIPRQPTPLRQYRLAQTGEVPAAARAAAWLAVPGHHPNDSSTAFRAYVQLARELFTRAEPDRLDALADELGRHAEGRPDGPDWRALATVSHAAASAIRGDAGAVQAQLGQIANFDALDPGVAELAFAAVQLARRRPPAAGPGGARLDDLAVRLLAPLDLDFPEARARASAPAGPE